MGGSLVPRDDAPVVANGSGSAVVFDAVSPVLERLAATAGVEPTLTQHLHAAATLARHSLADATLDTYEDSWDRFVAYCARFGFRVLPAEPATVAAWIGCMAFAERDAAGERIVGTGLTHSTIAQRLAAVDKAHEAAGFKRPSQHVAVKQTMKGLRRTLGVRPRRPVKPVASDLLGRILDEIRRPTYTQLRDHTCVQLLACPGIEIGPLARLDWADVHISASSVVATIPAPGRNRAPLRIEFGADEQGPGAALRELADLLGRPDGGPVIARAASSETPAPRAMSREALRTRIGSLLAAVGVDEAVHDLDPGALSLVVAHTLAPTAQQLRDAAAVLVGFFTAGRRSNLARLGWADFDHQPGEGIEVLFGRTKTDQDGEGTELWLPQATDERRCPVRAVLAWSGFIRHTLGTDPLTDPALGSVPFLTRLNGRGGLFLRDGRPVAVSGEAYATIVKRLVAATGEDGSMFAGHSTRAGFVTTAADAGMPLEQICEVTGHKRTTTVLRYIRRSRPHRQALGKRLGL